jgi:hypothetical protein
MRVSKGPLPHSRRGVHRLWAGVAWLGLLPAVGCEPQEIYLFDGPPTSTRIDAGGSEEPADIDMPDPPLEPPPSRPPPEPPACETAACNECVAQDCAAGSVLLFCHPRSGQCVLPCDASLGPDAAGNCPTGLHCDPAGICVDCLANADCGEPLRACDLVSNTCAECVVGGDTCPLARPVCDPAALRCVQCRVDAECAATGQVCLEAEQRCAQCESDLDCRGRDDDVVCLPGEQRCVECISDADCRLSEPDKPFCSSERECEDERK